MSAKKRSPAADSNVGLAMQESCAACLVSIDDCICEVRVRHVDFPKVAPDEVSALSNDPLRID